MRYIVVGTSGAGKSTFAQALAGSIECPYIELDRLYREENWQAVSQFQFENPVRGRRQVAVQSERN